ncbi:DUF4870 domain-containing protein [Rhodanobacter sp. 115]|uniref:DUF4870 domain-containing protein n=1 Tax=Rhodanobacter sp. FW021-MT20 TaxID=1162282 RepID=UPI000260F0C8|nr:DUF4870 domain-containing protein [Rhodanobacter sp. 115]EIL87716.1 hypothetical protein UU5_18337 [Rhodanobacter sp. 115]
MSVPPESAVPPPSPDDVPPPPIGPSREERQWALFAHLSALLAGLLTGHWLGVGCFIGPLIIWLAKREGMPFVDDQAKEALNFNITVAIAALVCGLLMFVLIGFVLLPILGVLWLVCVILAAIKANEGERYRYPFALRFESSRRQGFGTGGCVAATGSFS